MSDIAFNLIRFYFFIFFNLFLFFIWLEPYKAHKPSDWVYTEFARVAILLLDASWYKIHCVILQCPRPLRIKSLRCPFWTGPLAVFLNQLVSMRFTTITFGFVAAMGLLFGMLSNNVNAFVVSILMYGKQYKILYILFNLFINSCNSVQ